ncbi:MAG: hypothetical protein H6719_37430 [Sandaracinaceae bacterium]|nr:hypothetical protein [Sandaracinaceae bacterium]
MRAIAGVALLLVGCGPELTTTPLEVGDLGFFTARVEPHLEARCGSAGCHGRPDRPFAVYAPGQHRRDAGRTWLDEPLDRDEVEENALRVSAFGIGRDPFETLIVQKPLSPEEGGLWHGGGDVFAGRNDEGCRALTAWLLGRTLPVDGGAP